LISAVLEKVWSLSEEAPMSAETRNPRVLILFTLVAAIGALMAPRIAAAQMPTDPNEALRVFELEASPSDWANGPVQYLFTKDERDIWNEIDDDEERRDFITWFWERRDEDLRDRRNPFQEGFYTRVATANDRFAEFPRGWKSDRGRTWVILGRPDGIRAGGLDSEVWSYSTYGGILRAQSYLGEMQIGFRRVDTGKWEIGGGVGPGAWPPYVLQAFDVVNRASVVNPDLEWK